MHNIPKLEIFLRTCDRVNVHQDWRVRYCGFEKPLIVTGCLKSLVRAIQMVKDYDITLTVLDDHSSEETVQQIKTTLSKLDKSNFIALEQWGYNYSAHRQWLMCRDSTADLVYSVEDDYLHCDTAIKEMLESFRFFSERLKHNNIALYPFDFPGEYNPPRARDFVVHGSRRHWRTGTYTTNVIMTRPQIFKDHWALFETLALKYNGDYLKPRVEHYDETNTIQKIWESGSAVRFSPLPSLALHLQFDNEKDPFINWQQWWDQYAQDL
jgi:hypothetical protein